MRNNHLPKTVLAVVLSAVIATTSLPIWASGIPTVDIAAALELKANAVAQATQALDALKQAKKGIDEARQQYENYKGIITGNDKLGNFLNNPALNKIMPMGDWASIYSTVKDISSLRDRYGLKSDNASVQQQFDRILAGADMLERTYDASVSRVENAAQLRTLLNTAETPQQKADLQLRYQQEFLELQNQQMRIANIQALMSQKKEIENTKRSRAFVDYMTGKSKVLPKYE